MNEIPIVVRNTNLEILAKMINSVAKQYDCRVDYLADENRLDFHGDQDCCRHITEETLALFPNDAMPPHHLKVRARINSPCRRPDLTEQNK